MNERKWMWVLKHEHKHKHQIRPGHFENRRCEPRPFSPRKTVSVARRFETKDGVRSSWPSRVCVRFRLELDRV
jgi:hypothetical protein